MNFKLKVFTFHAWFVGFFEGDGSFTINNANNRCFLIINQKDPKVLYYIRDVLKLGNIKEYDGIYRWSVTRKKDIVKVLGLLNGYLVLGKTNNRLKALIESFNSYNKLLPNDPEYLQYKGPGYFQAESSWLSGFMDAEACFNIRVVSLAEKKKQFIKEMLGLSSDKYKELVAVSPSRWINKIGKLPLDPAARRQSMSFRIRLRLIIKQKFGKELLEELKEVYTGSVKEDKRKKDVYVYTLDANFRQKKIIDYLKIHPLQSKKHIDFLKFKNTYFQLENKEHLNVFNTTSIISWLNRNQ